MNIKLFKKWDAAVIAVALAAALIFSLWSHRERGNPVAVITVGGEVFETVELSSVTDRITLNPDTDPDVVIVAENGEIWFENAGCEDRLCVAAGKLSKSGDTAVCLPAKTVITVEGSEVDAVVY